MGSERTHSEAQPRVIVERILSNHVYPPDQQEKATGTVLEQAARLSEQWATARNGIGPLLKHRPGG